jgi:hypothetical protein
MMVVCIKVGDKYGPEYVNRLNNMVRRHTTDKDLKFLCLTDDPKDLECDYADIGTSLPGWWSKLILFKPHKALDRRFLYLDLDTVITANIDPLLRYKGPFCILQDFWGRSYNSSVMMMVPGVHHHVWSLYNETVPQTFHGDQDWITACVGSPDLWQLVAPGVIGSYKADNLRESPKDYAVVCFHGDPKPHTFEEGWVHDYWI